MSVALANVREGVRSLLAARLRSVLGVLGIAVGIGSVVAMISTGEIAKEETRKRFRSLGPDIVSIAKNGRAGRIDTRAALALADEVSALRIAAPRLQLDGVVVYQGRNAGRATFQGVTQNLLQAARIEVRAGRFVSDLDERKMFCVIGAEVADKLRRIRLGDLVGQGITLEGRPFTIVGELQRAPASGGLPFDAAVDHSIFIPMGTAHRLEPELEVSGIVARAAPGAGHRRIEREVKAYFAASDPRLNVRVESADRLIEQMEAQVGLMTLLLGAVGSVSLIVGGIGIINVMLISVAQRRAEIGIRRAIGARRRDIRGQFLAEALLLTLSGGIAGGALGVGTTWGICRWTGWEPAVSVASIGLGVAVAVVTGLAAGLQPASQAAGLDPVRALET